MKLDFSISVLIEEVFNYVPDGVGTEYVILHEYLQLLYREVRVTVSDKVKAVPHDRFIE
jgi:hypothetical protein